MGYDPDFLVSSGGHSIPFPAAARESDPVRLAHYRHFSIAMNARRRTACFAAANIAAQQLCPAARPSERWVFDERLVETQKGNYFYSDSPFDRTRLVSRRQVAWGRSEEAEEAAAMTAYFTNATPLLGSLSRDVLWVKLAEHLCGHWRHDGRMTLLAGSVLRDEDPWFRGAQVPGAYWRVLALVDRGETPVCAAFVVTQTLTVSGDAVRGSGAFWQMRVADLGELLGCDFGVLRAADVLPSSAATAAAGVLGKAAVPLNELSDLRLGAPAAK